MRNPPRGVGLSYRVCAVTRRAPGSRAPRRFWGQWYRRPWPADSPPLITFARTLAPCSDGVINPCRGPLHTGLLEGINHKVQVLKRMAYGFRDDAYFFRKIRAAFLGNP